MEKDIKWPLKPKETETLKANVKKRLAIETRKLQILEKKLEECKAKLPSSVCNTKERDEAQRQISECKIALVKLGAAEQIASLKPGDQLTCYTSGYRRSDRETGFELLDFEFAMRKAKKDTWYTRNNLTIAELEVDEIRKDNRILAHSIYGKTKYLGIPLSEETPLIFYKIMK